MPGWSTPTGGVRRFDRPARGGAPLHRAARRSQRRSGRDRLDRLGARRHHLPGRHPEVADSRLQTADLSGDVRLSVFVPGAIRVDGRVVGVGERDAGAVAGAGLAGISNEAHATAALTRTLPWSSLKTMRTRWFGLRIVDDTTCAPTVERSTSWPRCRRPCTATMPGIRWRGARRVPRWSSAAGRAASGRAAGWRRPAPTRV